MELRHLRYFMTVAETASFTRAAERLHTVQPSLSRQMQDLEREVGAQLLNRSSRKIELTPAGAVFLDEARLVLAQAERAVQRTREVARANASRLTLGFTAGVEIDLAGVTTALGDDLKTVELTLRSQPSPELVRSLHARLIDAAFIRPDEDSKGLVVRTVRREPLLAAVPASHPLARAPAVQPSDLNNLPFITVNAEAAPVLHRAIRDFISEQGIRPSQTYEVEDLGMVFSLIASIGGITLLPEYAFRLCPPTVAAVRLELEPPMIDLALAYHPDNRSDVLRTFVSHFERLTAGGTTNPR